MAAFLFVMAFVAVLAGLVGLMVGPMPQVAGCPQALRALAAPASAWQANGGAVRPDR